MDINWKVFRASLDPDELRSFNGLCSRIRHFKQIIKVARAFRPLFKGNQPQCETHWLTNCYECNPIKSLDIIERKARKALNGARFLLRKMLVEHGLLPSAEPAQTTFAVALVDASHPIDKLFVHVRFDATAPFRGSDALDNMRLIESWMKERGI